MKMDTAFSSLPGLPAPVASLIGSEFVIFIIIFALLILCLISLFSFYFYSRYMRVHRSRVKPGVQISTDADQILTQLDLIRKTYLASGNFRKGCHALAELLRENIPGTKKHRLATSTASDIARLFPGPIGDTALSLSRHQFQRNSPQKNDFIQLCAGVSRIISKLDRIA